MNIEFVTVQDLIQVKNEILDEIRKLQSGNKAIEKKWLRTRDVIKLLNCSAGTLQNLRINGTIEFTRLGGTLLYSAESITKVLERNKINAN
jgi:hypothetical protein